MPDLSKLHEDVKRAHDELALKVHLGTRDLQDEWTRLEQRWREFESKAKLERSARDVGAAADLLGSELKGAYARLRKALQ